MCIDRRQSTQLRPYQMESGYLNIIDNTEVTANRSSSLNAYIWIMSETTAGASDLIIISSIQKQPEINLIFQ